MTATQASPEKKSPPTKRALLTPSFVGKPSTTRAEWWIIDADNVVLGRLAAEIATRIRGKHKPAYTPHLDDGDNVIVINAAHVKLTGNKLKNKLYHRHTGYPGGLKTQSAHHVLNGKHPERVLQKAVERMMPKGPLARRALRRLKIYPNGNHPHQAQNPKSLDFATRNPKNKR